MRLVTVGIVALSFGFAQAAEPATLQLVQTIVLKGKGGLLDHLGLDAKRDRLLLANKANGTLDVIDLKAGRLLKQVPGQTGIQGVAFAADLDRIFVGLGAGGYCNVFDASDYRPLKTIKFADDADNVRYDAERRQTLVAHAEQSLGFVDAKSYSIKADLKLPGSAEAFQVAKAVPRVYLAIPAPSQLVVIDADKRVIVNTFPIKSASGAHPVALDEANKRVFVGCRQPAAVVVVDSDLGKEIASVPIPQDIDDLFYDAKRKRLYASCGEGFVVVLRQIDADHYEQVEKLATAPQARTSLYDGASNRLFVAVPRQAGQPAPEIRVYRVRD